MLFALVIAQQAYNIIPNWECGFRSILIITQVLKVVQIDPKKLPQYIYKNIIKYLLSYRVLGSTSILASVFLFNVWYVHMTYNVIMNSYILSN